MSNKNTNDTANNEDDDEQYRDPEDKWEGFHFTRLTCISILTLIIMIVALILDNLSVWGKERKCTFQECAAEDCECGQQGSDGQYASYPVCEANGQCGWRTGSTKWIKPNPSSPNCPGCNNNTYCVSSSEKDGTINWDSEFNFRDLCQNHKVNGEKDDDACMAVDGGNVYLVFTIFAIIFNLFTLCLIAPLYCRDSSIFPCDICNEKTHIILGILYALTFFCNFIPVVVWLGAGDGGMCDNADPNHQDAFISDTTNFPGYSLGGLMICIVADIVACAAVCCCWGDNRHYGDDRDQAKIDRQREKEMYRQKEAEMQQQQQYNQQQQPQQQQQQAQQAQQYNNNNQGYPNQQYGNQQYGNQQYPNQGYPNQGYGGPPQQQQHQQQPNTTYSYN